MKATMMVPMKPALLPGAISPISNPAKKAPIIRRCRQPSRRRFPHKLFGNPTGVQVHNQPRKQSTRLKCYDVLLWYSPRPLIAMITISQDAYGKVVPTARLTSAFSLRPCHPPGLANKLSLA